MTLDEIYMTRLDFRTLIGWWCKHCPLRILQNKRHIVILIFRIFRTRRVYISITLYSTSHTTLCIGNRIKLKAIGSGHSVLRRRAFEHRFTILTTSLEVMILSCIILINSLFPDAPSVPFWIYFMCPSKGTTPEAKEWLMLKDYFILAMIISYVVAVYPKCFSFSFQLYN